MLADLMNVRSAVGGDRGRDDLHRHATFSCAVRARFAKIMKWLRLA